MLRSHGFGLKPGTYVGLPGFQEVIGLALSASNQALGTVDGNRAEFWPLLVESDSVAEGIRGRSSGAVLYASFDFETMFKAQG